MACRNLNFQVHVERFRTRVADHEWRSGQSSHRVGLADGKVLFQGQEVAFVVASDRYVAADAVELVEVEYEELPVITDPFESLKSDVVLREDLAGQTEGAQGPRKHHNHIFTW